MEEIFGQYLKKAGLPFTDENRLVARVFENTDNHISPEEIYNIIHEAGIRIGIAAVWRSLRLLRRAGLAEEHYFGKAGVHYEKKRAPESHGHIVCNECGRTEEFDLSGFLPQINELAANQDFDLEGYELSLFGRCRTCRGKVPAVIDENLENNEPR